MRRNILFVVALAAGLLASRPAASQESTSYKLREQVLNSGGNPAGGSLLTSPAFRMRLDALGQGVIGAGLSSAGWRMDGGFTSAYPPPGEVTGVRFGFDGVTLTWNPERSVGTYSLYRGVMPAFLPAAGVCREPGLTGETAEDMDVPPVGGGFFYLLTVRNRLGEEGTKGFASSGAERPNPSPCP